MRRRSGLMWLLGLRRRDCACSLFGCVAPMQKARVRLGEPNVDRPANTRDFFPSEAPWDSYNVECVDQQRGANSIRFGQGSPAGIINVGLKTAQFRNFGTVCSTADLNHVLIPKKRGRGAGH